MPYGYGSANKGSTNQGPPGGGDPRMTYTAPPVTTGGPPGGGDPRMTYTKPPVTTGGQSPFAYTKKKTAPVTTGGGITGINNRNILNWLKSKAGKYTGYTQHNINNPKLKLALAAGDITEEQYKLMGGYDVAQQFPGGIFDVPMVGVASGVYQGAKSLAGGLDKLGWIDDTQGMSKYGKYGAWESADLNMAGAQGLNPSDLQRYEAIVGGHQEVGGMLPGGHLPGVSEAPSLTKYATKAGEKIYDWTHKAADGGRASYFDGGLLSLWPR